VVACLIVTLAIVVIVLTVMRLYKVRELRLGVSPDLGSLFELPLVEERKESHHHFPILRYHVRVPVHQRPHHVVILQTLRATPNMRDNAEMSHQQRS
jgi:hypothetical protein